MWCFVHFDLEMCFAPQRRALFQHPNLQKWRKHVVFCTFSLRNVLRATTACTFSTSKSGANMWCFVHFHLEMCFAPQRRALFQHPNLQKWREHVVFCTFSLGNVLRATTACTFSTSKSGANMWCFVHFHFEMCFAPQRRALFQHPNLQKWREHVVFCTFSLGNVLRATTACTFSTSEPPKVARTCGVLYILTSKCALRHNGAHFFDISTSKSGPSMLCFAHFDFQMCFAPQRRALFRHLNFQKWSEHGVFCAF